MKSWPEECKYSVHVDVSHTELRQVPKYGEAAHN